MAKQFVCTSTEPIVQTSAGKYRGFIVDGTYTFHGIKYADAERFQMPKAPKSFEGVKDAHSYGYVCPMLSPETATGEIMVPHRYWPKDENCQYLNIWSQSIDKEAKKPVMVWLHGGGFAAGSSIEQICYDGENLSEYGDVVVVSLNHRLNILGFIDPGITVNIINDGKLVKREHLKLPERIRDVIRCKNPRCITSTEQELKQIFKLTDREKRVYRCIYCETAAK